MKSAIGVGKRVKWQQQNYPRDYCALYRRQVLVDHGLTFCGKTGGGYSIARQLWDAGFSTPVFPVREMAKCVYHIAHGTAAIAPEKRLNHARKQKQTERKLARLIEANWIRALQIDWTLDEREWDGLKMASPPAGNGARPALARGRNSKMDCSSRRRDDLIRTGREPASSRRPGKRRNRDQAMSLPPLCTKSLRCRISSRASIRPESTRRSPSSNSRLSDWTAKSRDHLDVT